MTRLWAGSRGHGGGGDEIQGVRWTLKSGSTHSERKFQPFSTQKGLHAPQKCRGTGFSLVTCPQLFFASSSPFRRVLLPKMCKCAPLSLWLLTPSPQAVWVCWDDGRAPAYFLLPRPLEALFFPEPLFRLDGAAELPASFSPALTFSGIYPHESMKELSSHSERVFCLGP